MESSKEKNHAYYRACGIRENWFYKTVKEFENDPEAKKMVQSYLQQLKDMVRKGIGLYLWGANGTGKSHLMHCTFKALLHQRYTVKILTLDELVDKFTASWYNEEVKANFHRILLTVQFLGIDEFGKNVGADGEPNYLPDLVKRVIEEVIRYRVHTKKPIWITSNTEPKNVASVFSEDVASLLSEACVPVKVCGCDYRKIIQKRNKLLLK